MQQAHIIGFGFDSVTNGVAEVQDAAKVTFALVGGDHFGFDFDRGGDEPINGRRVHGKNLTALSIEQVEQFGIANDPAFHYLEKSGAVFAGRQSG